MRRYIVSAHTLEEGPVAEVILVVLAKGQEEARELFQNHMEKVSLTYFHANCEPFSRKE